MMDAFRAEAIRLALVKMFRQGGHFDICTVRSCLESASIEAPKEEMDALRPLHCVGWSEMTPEMRTEVQRRVLALFSLPATDLDAFGTPLVGGAPREVGSAELFRRLIGRGADA